MDGKEMVMVGCAIVCIYAVVGAALLSGAVWIIKSVWGA